MSEGMVALCVPLFLSPRGLVPGAHLCYNIFATTSGPFGNVARVAELADALASGASDSNVVQVQPLSRAPEEPSKNPKFILDFLRIRMVP